MSFIRVFFVLCGSFAVACSASVSGDGSSGASGGPAAPPSTTPPGGPTSSATTPPPPPPAPAAKAHLRFANAAYQTGIVDFCVRKQGASSWEGPLLHALGVAGGADQGTLTRAFERDAGAWEVVVVGKAATGCDKPIVTATSPITLAEGGGALAILRGNGGIVSGVEKLDVASIADEATAPAAGKAHVRFFHASPNWMSGAASVWIGMSQATFTGVAFGQLAKSSTIGSPTAAGYVDVPTTQRDITVKGLSDFDGPREVLGSWSPKAGARTTLLFEGAAGSGFYPPVVLSCEDDDTLATASDAFATCAAQ